MADASNNDGLVFVVAFDDDMRLSLMQTMLQSGLTLREQQEDSKVGTRRAVNAAAPLILFARALCATFLLCALLRLRSHNFN